MSCAWFYAVNIAAVAVTRVFYSYSGLVNDSGRSEVEEALWTHSNLQIHKQTHTHTHTHTTFTDTCPYAFTFVRSLSPSDRITLRDVCAACTWMCFSARWPGGRDENRAWYGSRERDNPICGLKCVMTTKQKRIGKKPSDPMCTLRVRI